MGKFYFEAMGNPRCRHIPGETYEQRHVRRWKFNVDALPLIQAWCDRYEIKLTLDENVGHWQFISEHGGKLIADWWPQSAKLVINERWSKELHCHDFFQLTAELTRKECKSDSRPPRRGMRLDAIPITRKEYYQWYRTQMGKPIY